MRLVHVAVLLLLTGGCSAPRLSLTPRVASLGLDGHISAVDTSGGGSSSAESDTDALGLGDDETVFAPRVDLDWGGTHLTLDYLDTSYSGSGMVEGQIDLGGTTIPAGDSVDSQLDLGLTQAAISWDFVPGETLDLGLGVGLVVADLSAKITSQTTSESAETDETVPLPVLVGRAGLNFGRFSIGALARGLALHVRDVDAQYLDLDLMARYRLFQRANGNFAGALTAGYRAISLQAEFDDGDDHVDIDLELTGPYVGFSFTL